MTLTAPYTAVSGSLVHVGNIVGVAVGDAASAAPVAVELVGVFGLTHAVTNTAAAIGDFAYYDTTNRAISATTTFAKVGVYVAAKVTTSTAVTVRLNGTF
jgi:predicted RecA/RadA family phage recombinase